MHLTDTIIIGAGQAGLAASHELTSRDENHIVLEKGKIGQSWRDRWESFCLVTPNWSVQLPGYPYDGDDPDGFMPRDEIVAYLERYAASFAAPVRSGSEILEISKAKGGLFSVSTTDETFASRNLLLATGAYQKPKKPNGVETLPADLPQLALGDYVSERQLPEGDILIIGSGQSGCQIAEELQQAGRRVVLACGRAPWGPRRIDGQDLFWWLAKSGFLDAPVNDLPPEAKLFANILASGHQGGHDMTLRTLHDIGVELTGHFIGATGSTAEFAEDLKQSIEWGDARYLLLKDVFSKAAEKLGLSEPTLPEPKAFNPQAQTKIDLESFGATIFTGGFRPDYNSWLPWGDAFDGDGFPIHSAGSSTVVEGLHFVGVHFLRTRKSALLFGVGDDAGIVADKISGS